MSKIEQLSRSTQAEEAVIVSLILDPVLLDEIGDILQPQDFNDFFNQELYKNIREMIGQSKKLDQICLAKYMADKHYIGNENEVFKKICEIFVKTIAFARKGDHLKAYVNILKEEALDRNLARFGQEIIASVHNSDPNRLDDAQRKIESLVEGKHTEIFSVAQMMPSVIQDIADGCESEEPVGGVKTGFKDIDEITNGLYPSDLIILAARPSMGKTLLAMNIAEHVALKLSKTVAVFSLEMKSKQLIERSLASTAKISSEMIRKRRLTQEEIHKITMTAADYTNNNFLFIDDRSASVYDLRARARKIKKEHGLSLVVVDYLTLISGEGENETMRVGNISRDLKAMARDLDVPVIAISQLNRALEHGHADRRPTMASLRQSGAIEQDADVILFIYRDEVYNSKSKHIGYAEIIVAKQRNGSIGKIYLKFNGNQARFEDCLEPPQDVTEEVKPRSRKNTKWDGYN